MTIDMQKALAIATLDPGTPTPSVATFGMDTDEMLDLVCRALVAAHADLEELRAENARLMSLVGQAMDPPAPTDMRADYLAAWLHLTNAGIPVLVDGKPATMGERVKMLAASRDEARRERDVFSSDNLRKERDEAKAQLEEMRSKTLNLVLEHDRVVMDRDALERRLQLQHVKCFHCGLDFGEHERGVVDPVVHAHVVSCSEHPLAKERDEAEAQLARLQPILSLLADWEFAELDRHDLARNDLLADRVCEALRAVEVNEKKAKEVDRG